ncbi:hypothetical protein [Noviherbaspirillum massiliense]|uniref:hypothetical protein n=1 Tax=Noviherbaspirillum massiliense TaxID=1465823 RepID=UPI000303B508|nr:hypothetical protein [Noviherbaspirillum massiliense]
MMKVLENTKKTLGKPLRFASRRNVAVADIVNQGVAMQERCGTRQAAEFLRLWKVNVDVAKRVLLCKDARRQHHAGTPSLPDPE